MAMILFQMTGYTPNCPDDKHVYAEELERAHRAISGAIASISGQYPPLYHGEANIIEASFASGSEATTMLSAIKTEIAHKKPTPHIRYAVGWPNLQVNQTCWRVSIRGTDVADD
jgi:hypothetical protein